MKIELIERWLNMMKSINAQGRPFVKYCCWRERLMSQCGVIQTRLPTDVNASLKHVTPVAGGQVEPGRKFQVSARRDGGGWPSMVGALQGPLMLTPLHFRDKTGASEQRQRWSTAPTGCNSWVVCLHGRSRRTFKPVLDLTAADSTRVGRWFRE